MTKAVRSESDNAAEDALVDAARSRCDVEHLSEGADSHRSVALHGDIRKRSAGFDVVLESSLLDGAAWGLRQIWESELVVLPLVSQDLLSVI